MLLWDMSSLWDIWESYNERAALPQILMYLNLALARAAQTGTS